MCLIHDRDDRPSSSVRFVQIFHVDTAKSLESITLVNYYVHAVFLHDAITYKRCPIGDGLISTDVLSKKFEATGKGDAESHFSNNSSHEWFTGSEEILLEADLIPLKSRNLMERKVSLIRVGEQRSLSS